MYPCFTNYPLLQYLLHLPQIKQAIVLLDNFYLTNRGFFMPSPVFKEGFGIVIASLILQSLPVIS